MGSFVCCLGVGEKLKQKKDRDFEISDMKKLYFWGGRQMAEWLARVI